MIPAQGLLRQVEPESGSIGTGRGSNRTKIMAFAMLRSVWGGMFIAREPYFEATAPQKRKRFPDGELYMSS
jgi:hypothetical protein